jgi:hypothetical protein
MITDSPTSPDKKWAVQVCEDGLYRLFQLGLLAESDHEWLGDEEYDRLTRFSAAGFRVTVAQTLAHNVGVVRIPEDVDTDDLDQMQPFLQEGANLLEAGHDYIEFIAGDAA